MSFKKLSVYFFGSLLCYSSFNALASRALTNYDELLLALDAGSKVRGVVHFDKCKLESGGGLPQTITFGFTYDYYNHYNLPVDNDHTIEVISTSHNIFSLTKINNLGPVNNYMQIRVFKDNTAQLIGVILDPINYSQKITVNYTCPISSNPIQAGLMLFNPDAN